MICQLRKTCARSYDFHYGWTRPFPLRIFGCKHGNRSFPRFNAIRVFSVEKAQKRIPFTHSRAHWCTVKKKISGLVYFCEDIPWFCASCIYILIYDISLIWYHMSEIWYGGKKISKIRICANIFYNDYNRIINIIVIEKLISK